MAKNIHGDDKRREHHTFEPGRKTASAL